MKKLIALLLAMVMIFALFACGEDSGSRSGGKGNKGGNWKDKDTTAGSTSGNTTTTGNGNVTTSTSGNPPASSTTTQPVQTQPVQTQPPMPTEPQPTTPGPSSELAGTYDITVWVPDAIVELTRAQIADFNATNTLGIIINAIVEPVEPGDAANAMMIDPEYGADLFCFTQDQTACLVQAGALSQLGANATNLVKENHDQISVSSVTVGGNVYGYPLSSDNGYFMYYDKSVISESEIGSLEALIVACERAGRNFSFELENAWYNASFFFATGCVSEWQTDADGTIIGVNDNFYSDLGRIAAEGMQKLLNSQCYNNSSVTSDFEAYKPSAVVISGVWNYENAKAILGSNLGMAELPSFEVNGKSYHLSSFGGCKLMGIKPQWDAKRAAALNLLAQYLTGEECQLARFEEYGWGPSNIAAQGSNAVKAAPYLTALMAQNNYARPQGQIHGTWWDIARVIATNLREGMAVEMALENYAENIAQIFNGPVYEWSVIGDLDGTCWDTDFDMVLQADGVYRTEYALYFQRWSQFLVRYGHNWEIIYGADGQFHGGNVAPGVEGYYYVWFDSTTGLIWIESA